MTRQIEASPAGRRGPGRRRAAGSAAVLAMTAAGTLLLGGPASAHVTVTPSTTAAGSYAVATVSVGHGCEGSPTTAVKISIPDSVYSVTPTRNPLWDVSVETEPVDPPVTDGHGATIDERVASVTYTTDDPLPDHQRDTFELSLRLPDEQGGSLVFPTVQTCEKGESAWIEVPSDGGDAEDLSLPAPSFVVTAAGAEHGEGEQAAAPAAHDDEDDSPSDLAVIGLGLVGGLVGGALVGLGLLVAWARSRRTS